jgi:hypothetical protein
MNKSPLLAACVYLLTCTGTGAAQSAGTNHNPGEIYGVIEVGASGIKGVVVETTAPDPETPPAKVLKAYAPLDKNAFNLDASASGRVAEAVEQMYHEMEKDYNLAIGHLSVVGSSGVPENVRPNLAESILGKLRAKMEFINVEKEISLEFLGIVPARRFSQVVLIDIGSGNTKGAYTPRSEGSADLKTFQLPWGTKMWAHEINQTRGDGDFGLAADVLGQNKLLPAIRQFAQENPELNSRRRVYLAGGITWAMCRLLHPYDQGSWVRINDSDIDSFYERAKNNPASLLDPDLNQAPKGLHGEELETAKQKAKSEIMKVRDVFSQDQLVAGAQILKGLKETLGFAKKDAVFFAGEKALYAWDIGYVLEKVQAGG